MSPCKNPDCQNTVSERMEHGFCFTCASTLYRDSLDLGEELDRVLRLEAEFVAYCLERGLPHPHE